MTEQKAPRPVSDGLRQKIEESGLTMYQLSQQSGVHRSQLSRFMRRERNLTLDAVDEICRVLNIHLVGLGGVGGTVEAALSAANTSGPRAKKTSKGRPGKQRGAP